MTMHLPLQGDKTPSFISELLYRLKIRDVMTRQVVCAAPQDSLRTIQGLMKTNNITGVPITRQQRLLGIISMDDIIQALDLGHIEAPAEVHMSRNLIILEDDMPLAFGLSYMEKYHFGRFPVLDRSGTLVGIITSRDIILHLLLAMNQEMELMEQQLNPPRPAVGDSGTGCLDFNIRRYDFENAGKASSEIKKACARAGLDSKLTRRIAVASYELEMNQVIHSIGGNLYFTLGATEARVEARDQGPGIPDLEKALAEGWSTANEWVRSLGFGAGMGLPNTRRVSDDFHIESGSAGTLVSCSFRIPGEETEREQQ